MDIGQAAANDLLAAVRNRSLSSREILDQLLNRVERDNPSINAVVALDVERARAEAADADEATARGTVTGPLHGLPMTVKDVWETEGLATTSGAPELSGHVPTADALAVARLKQAGAIVFGKTNVPMYAGDFQTFNDVYGVTNNPWDTSRTAGGSSGGAAVAVAAGLTPLELGSDIGGSIRNPAHYNGVYGLKPSWGVVPSRGHIPGPPGSLVEPDVGCGGPLARRIPDLRTALEVVAGPLPEDATAWRLHLDAGEPIADISAMRVATVFDQGRDVLPIAGDVAALLDGYAGRLADAGARVEAVRLPVTLGDGLRAWQELVMPIIGLGLPDHVYADLAAMDETADESPAATSARALASRYRSWARADERRQHQRGAWAALFEHHDVVLAPAMPTAAFPHDIESSIAERVINVDGTPVPHMISIAWCAAVGSVLLPVVTLPTGLTPEGLPVGVQAIGPYLSDLRLLDVAELMDSAAGPGLSAPPRFA